MIDYWVEWKIVLDGGMYEQQDATACFRVEPGDHWIELETISIDGCIYHASIIEKQIGKQAMADIIKRAEAWWDDEGYPRWKLGQQLNGEKFDA